MNLEETSLQTEQHELQELLALIRTLRAPDGCPWDRKQTKQDMAKYLLDEAYELFDALAENDLPHIREELGDLLFLTLFVSEIASEAREFTLADAMKAIKEKMIRRHPHVFGDVKVNSVQDIKDNWQEIKKQERADEESDQNIFSNIPRSLPALKRAYKIATVASRYGFDWQKTDDVWEKLKEEINELDQARTENDARKIEEEMGDVLFTLVNLSRFVHVDPEQALSGTIDKFLKRFAYVTRMLADRGQSLEGASLNEMDELWNEAKKRD